MGLHVHERLVPKGSLCPVSLLTKEPQERLSQIFQNDRSMALIALLVLLISSTCQAFGVPSASRCRAPAAATTLVQTLKSGVLPNPVSSWDPSFSPSHSGL